MDEVARRRAGLASWQAWLHATGAVRRLTPSPEVARRLLEQVAAVLPRLPAGGIPIGRLAAECCADAHALGGGVPVGTLALSAARAPAGLPIASGGSAYSRRAAWAAVGAQLDELSSLVLSLGLVGDPRTPLGRVLSVHRDAGQPAAITLRQLRCQGEPLSARTVHVCENPVVVAAAADELGSACALRLPQTGAGHHGPFRMRGGRRRRRGARSSAAGGRPRGKAFRELPPGDAVLAGQERAQLVW